MRNYVDRIFAESAKVKKKRGRIPSTEFYQNERTAPIKAPKWTLSGYDGSLVGAINDACRKIPPARKPELSREKGESSEESDSEFDPKKVYDKDDSPPPPPSEELADTLRTPLPTGPLPTGLYNPSPRPDPLTPFTLNVDLDNDTRMTSTQSSEHRLSSQTSDPNPSIQESIDTQFRPQTIPRKDRTKRK